MYSTIKVTTSGRAALITLDRPEVRNAFDERMIAELHQAVEAAGAQDEIRALVITGAGTAFSAGADINWMRRMGEAGFDDNYQDALGLANMLDALGNCPKPTIARVNGPAIGGGTGLVAACDIAIGADQAFFSFSEVKIGLVPACIAPYIIRRVGPGRAAELFISGRRIGAAEAERIGLLNFTIERDKLDAKVEEVLSQLFASGPRAIEAAKQLIREVPMQTREEYIAYTAKMIADLRTSPEGREGTRAFLAHRPPQWLKVSSSKVNSGD